MSTRHRGLGIVVAIVLAAALGCGGQAGAAPPPVTASSSSAVVEMPPSYRFEPRAIQVAAGTTVTFRNTDNFTHSVSVGQGDLPYLDLGPGESGQITFEEPGEYEYVCTYHAQDMQGKVTVTPA